MIKENIGYILQIATLTLTLMLGLFNAYQNKKLQRGQNIISVTTNYRMKRCEQLKECGQKLMTNTEPELLKLNAEKSTMLCEAYTASETISMIMHRHFPCDRELIDMAAEIVALATRYSKDFSDIKAFHELEYKRKLFRIKCDIYTTADWNRIKSETDGVNSSAIDWTSYYKKIEKSFSDELNEIKNEFEKLMTSK